MRCMTITLYISVIALCHDLRNHSAHWLARCLNKMGQCIQTISCNILGIYFHCTYYVTLYSLSHRLYQHRPFSLPLDALSRFIEDVVLDRVMINVRCLYVGLHDLPFHGAIGAFNAPWAHADDSWIKVSSSAGQCRLSVEELPNVSVVCK